jgi:hypothetical protein
MWIILGLTSSVEGQLRTVGVDAVEEDHAGPRGWRS